jgi:hypothetical protein
MEELSSHPASTGAAGSGRRRLVLLTLAVLAVLALAGGGAALAHDSRRPPTFGPDYPPGSTGHVPRDPLARTPFGNGSATGRPGAQPGAPPRVST